MNAQLPSVANACQCESVEHFDEHEPRSAHPYLSVDAEPGTNALYVGPICHECATGHLREYTTSILFEGTGVR